MKDARRNQDTGSPARNRAERRAAGLVAEYIHELSGRHGGPVKAVTGRASDALVPLQCGGGA